MTSHDKPLLAKQLFKLINFEICDKGVKFKQEIHAGVGAGFICFKKSLYHFRFLSYIIVN